MISPPVTADHKFKDRSKLLTESKVSALNSSLPTTLKFSIATESFGKCLKAETFTPVKSTVAFMCLFTCSFTMEVIFPLNNNGIVNRSTNITTSTIPKVLKIFLVIYNCINCLLHY